MRVVIPLAGAGSRFGACLWHRGKPLIDIAGKPMLQRVIENVAPDDATVAAAVRYIFIARRDYAPHLPGLIERVLPGADVIVRYLDTVLEGAALTIESVADLLDDDDGGPVFVVNSDQLLDWDKRAFYERLVSGADDGLILTFEPQPATTAWSYVRLDADGDAVAEVREKVVISGTATVGAYAWRSGRDLVASLRRMVAAGDRTNGEFYVAPIYNHAAAGKKYRTFPVTAMHGVGTPRDLVAFLRDHVRAPQDRAPPCARTSHPARLIAHRANVTGGAPLAGPANSEEAAEAALRAGFDVELDAWLLDEWWLGHDAPERLVRYELFTRAGVIVHAKNAAALAALAGDPRVHCFAHDRDDAVLTSRRLLWVYPDRPLAGAAGENRAVAVMFSGSARARAGLLARGEAMGLCADDVADVRAELAGAPAVRVDAVVFDMDGTLVETRNLHKDALNAALREVAGEAWVIGEREHAAAYDGLSTAQKLKRLNAVAGLDPALNAGVWRRKQELTDAFVRAQVAPDARIRDVILELKRSGFAVGVASNCVRSSVDLILECLGVRDVVDLSLSNCDVERAKPAPDMYARAAESFGVSPERLLVVEDAPFGWQAALSAGCHLLRVRRPADVTAEAVLARAAEIDATRAEHVVTVLVTLAGMDAPRAHCGGGGASTQERPACALDARGRSALARVAESLMSRRHAVRFIFVVLGDAVSDALLYEATAHSAPTSVVRLRRPTRGALETCLAAAHLLEPGAPLVVVDGRHVVEWPPGQDADDLLLLAPAAGDAAAAVVVCDDPRWCYAAVDASGSRILEVGEKSRISELALTGLFFWRTAASFLADARAVVSSGRRVRGNFFVASALTAAAARGASVRAARVAAMHSLRTQAEVAAYEAVHFARNRVAEAAGVLADMRARWKGAAVTVGVDPRGDARRCLALYAPAAAASLALGAAAAAAMGDIARDFSTHLVYDVDDNLHFTFMKLTDFSEQAPAADATAAAAAEAIVTSRIAAPFYVDFGDIVVTSASILIVGVPDVDVNATRAELARYFPEAPFGQNICHMTLVRFVRELTDAESAAVARLPERLTGARMRVRSLRFGACDLAMRDTARDAHTGINIELC